MVKIISDINESQIKARLEDVLKKHAYEWIGHVQISLEAGNFVKRVYYLVAVKKDETLSKLYFDLADDEAKVINLSEEQLAKVDHYHIDKKIEKYRAKEKL